MNDATPLLPTHPPGISAQDPHHHLYLEAVSEERRSIGQQVLHSMIGLYVLEGYDQVGVTLSLIFDTEDRPSSPFFVPWGAVIRLEFPGQRGGTAGG